MPSSVPEALVSQRTEANVALHPRDRISLPTEPQPLVLVKPAVLLIPPILVVLKVVFLLN